MSRIVNIGIVQMDSKLGDAPYNTDHAKSLIDIAVKAGANIICLPELFATGYNLSVLKDNVVKLSIQYYEQICQEISDIAKHNKVYIIAPFGEKGEVSGVVYNSALLFDDEGKMMGSFAKTHLWALERLYFKEGSRYPVFETKYGKIGIMICYDAGFPEACRSLCLKGAEIVFVPAAWRKQDKDMWDLNLRQRSLENLLFTVGVNRVGVEEDLRLFGGSKICNPRSEVICELPIDKEDVTVFSIDLDEVVDQRIQIPYLRDRKPWLYTKLVEM